MLGSTDRASEQTKFQAGRRIGGENYSRALPRLAAVLLSRRAPTNTSLSVPFAERPILPVTSPYGASRIYRGCVFDSSSENGRAPRSRDYRPDTSDGVGKKRLDFSKHSDAQDGDEHPPGHHRAHDAEGSPCARRRGLRAARLMIGEIDALLAMRIAVARQDPRLPGRANPLWGISDGYHRS